MRAILAWLRRRRLDRDLEKELRFHLEQHVSDLVATGLLREEADRRARIELGGVEQVKERVRQGRSGVWLDHLMHDVRDAWRALTRTPGITLTAVTLIALVIGGNTTVFSIIHGILTKPAPGVQATGLVKLDLFINGSPYNGGHS